MSPHPVLDVKGACKSFGALRAVNAISLSVRPNEIFGIAGPNGSGKSTLFNIITGIPFPADSGRFLLAGEDIGRVRPDERFRRGLARTFQTETSFEALSVRDNLKLAATFCGRPEAVDALPAVVERVGLAKRLLDQPSGEISVFDRKKLMIATAIVHKPQIVLLDEPAAGLTRREVDELKSLIFAVRDDGIAVLLIEHVLPLLLAASERVLVMNQGEEVMTGTPDEITGDRRVIEAYLGWAT